MTKLTTRKAQVNHFNGRSGMSQARIDAANAAQYESISVAEHMGRLAAQRRIDEMTLWN